MRPAGSEPQPAGEWSRRDAIDIDGLSREAENERERVSQSFGV